MTDEQTAFIITGNITTDAALAEIIRLRAENEKLAALSAKSSQESSQLRAALKPFAITSTLMEGAGGDELFTISTYVKDFRAAAAALKETDNA